MENNILSSTKNPFLHREEILMEVTNSVCPTIEEVINLIGKEKEVVVVKKIQNNFGTNKFNVEILVYNDEESKKKVEVIPKKRSIQTNLLLKNTQNIRWKEIKLLKRQDLVHDVALEFF
jgi:ribosomal protein S24E